MTIEAALMALVAIFGVWLLWPLMLVCVIVSGFIIIGGGIGAVEMARGWYGDRKRARRKQ